jgi:3-hydroxyacyl-[acyl-carrier-protein] dehydratase
MTAANAAAPDAPPKPNPLADCQSLMAMLQHRYPFLLIDKVLEVRPKGITAQKNVSFNEPYFQGHFPGNPVMPGVLILEGMAQAGCVYIGQREGRPKTIFLAAIDNARFKRPVRPGDILIYECEMTSEKMRIGKVACKATVDGKLAVAADMTFAITD